MSLRDRLIKNSTIKHTDVLAESTFFTQKDMIPTQIPAINIALSGSLEGGLTPGFTMFAGPSKHFKTLFSLILAKAYMDKYDDAVMLFYDSEFGTPIAYFQSLGIDMDRVIHTPITDVEQLKFDSMKQLGEIERGDHLITVIDSIGNLASKKEVEDALDGKSVADMSRAKQLKSLFRMITPHLTIKNIPLIAVNHTYMTLEMFSKPVVGGGTGSYYSADNIYIIGRQQEKDGKELSGYNFIINVEKSRHVKEKSKIPVTVTFEGGISKYSGLLDIALETGHVIKPSMGWYSRVNMETGEIDEKKFRAKETNTKEFWAPVFADPTFNVAIEKMYKVGHSSMLDEQEEIETID